MPRRSLTWAKPKLVQVENNTKVNPKIYFCIADTTLTWASPELVQIIIQAAE